MGPKMRVTLVVEDKNAIGVFSGEILSYGTTIDIQPVAKQTDLGEFAKARPKKLTMTIEIEPPGLVWTTREVTKDAASDEVVQLRGSSPPPEPRR